MQQFVVPQFIDNEDHIIGPVTTRQFLILMGMGFFIFLTYRLGDFSAFLVLTPIISAIGLTLAFARPNGRPFHFFLLNIAQTYRRPNLRVWKKKATFSEIEEDIRERKVSTDIAPQLVRRAPVTTSRLSELSLVVDTGGVYRGETPGEVK